MANHDQPHDIELDPMAEYEDLKRQVDAMIACLSINRDKLTASGMNIPEEIIHLRRELQRAHRSYVASDKATDSFLHATADAASHRANLYEPLRKALELMKANDPLNPLIVKVEEIVEQLRQELPKQLEK